MQRLGASENAAYLRVSALVPGRKVDEQLTIVRRKRGVGAVPAGRTVSYERRWQMGGSLERIMAAFDKRRNVRCLYR